MVEGITENTKIQIHVGGDQYPLTVNQYNTFLKNFTLENTIKWTFQSLGK